MNLSSFHNLVSPQTFLISSSNYKSLFLGGSLYGKRSPNKPKKISRSTTGIFGKLKSLKALIKISYSGRSGSALLKPPATVSTDLIALRPQS